MIPLKLSFQGFGPYVKKQNIDFESLRKHKLFLIYGETGAGKTVILDAMSYALYGKSSGSSRGDFESMRCRFAPDDLPTEISFTFEIDDHIYCFKRSTSVRVNRKKEQVYATKIDAGEMIDAQFHPFYENPKLKNIEEKAISLLHLTHDQFASVIMLPQGQFENFLIADSESKQAILKTLFAVEDYDQYARVLNEKVKEMKLIVDENELKKKIALQSVSIDQSEDIETLKQTLINTQSNLEATIKQAKIALDQDLAELNKQKAAKEIKTTLDQAITLLTAHTQQQKHRDDLVDVVKELKAKQNRLPLLKQYQSLFEKKEEHQKVYDEHEVIYQDISQQVKNLLLKKTSFEEKKESVEKNALYLHNMEASKAIIIQVQASKKELLQNNQLQNEYQTTMNQYVIKEEEYQKQKIANTNALKKMESSEQDVLKLTKENMLWEQGEQDNESYQKNLKSQAELNQQLLDCKETLKKQETIYQQAFDLHEQVYQEYLDNQIISLSKRLKPGKPCPVCGSLNHPDIKEAHLAFHEIKDLAQCKEARDKAYELVSTIRFKIKSDQATIQSLKEAAQQIKQRMVAYLNTEYNKEYHAALKAKLLKANEVRKQKDEMLQAKEKLELSFTTLQADKQALIMKGQKISETKAILENKITTLEKQLYENISDLDTITLKINCKLVEQKQLQSEINDYQTLVNEGQIKIAKEASFLENLKQQIMDTNNELEQLRKVLEKALPTNFTSVENWLTSISAYETLPLKEQEIREYDDELLRLSTIIKENEGKIKDIKWLDIDALSLKLADCEKEYEAQLESLRKVQSDLERLCLVEKQVNNYDRMNKTYGPKLLKLSDFTKAIRGDNGVGLQRYVLGIMLSNISATANQLLRYVHNGRYRIHRSDLTSSRIRKGGLELSIYDSYSGSDRSVLSLSGGEKFLVSLALSLALSTSIQSRNGGVCIQAMFIDEGFGSLDENSIDDALLVLSSIAHGKGMIGIISHVEQLKENIATSIEVVKSSEGSILHFHSED
ncbi:MAG: SMC family ATPase [Erysipelotrichaceae bacterium]